MKKVEQEEDDEISEPEDPIMLQRDAKDWKVCIHSFISFPIPLLLSLYMLTIYRAKITTPSSASASTAGAQHPSRSSVRTARRSSAITPTKRPPLEPPTKTTASSSASKRPTRSCWTPSSGASGTRSTRSPTSPRPAPRRRATSSSCGTRSSSPRRASPRSSLSR